MEGFRTGHYYLATELAHTSAPHPLLLGKILGGENSYVLNSPLIDQVAACFLLKEGDRSCTRITPTAAQSTAPSDAPTSHWSAKFEASGRLAVGLPPAAVLGQPLDIPVSIEESGPAVD